MMPKHLELHVNNIERMGHLVEPIKGANNTGSPKANTTMMTTTWSYICMIENHFKNATRV